MKKILALMLALICGSIVFAKHTPEGQAARQARSVHLNHRLKLKSPTVYYIEGTVIKAYSGTYVCLIGFHAGYCGLQKLGNGEHMAIFSIWEPSDPLDLSSNPDLVQEKTRTRNLYYGQGVNVARFGGEGTGGRSMMPFAWKDGEKVRMAISCAKDGDLRTSYTCWIYKVDGWFRMATFSSLVGAGKVELKGPYSFVEDFLRNVKSRDFVRVAQFSRLWAYNEDQGWQPAHAAGFNADNNALTTIDAGPAPSGHWLATGGKTQNTTVKLGSEMKPGMADLDDSALYREKLIEAIQAVEAPAAQQ